MTAIQRNALLTVAVLVSLASAQGAPVPASLFQGLQAKLQEKKFAEVVSQVEDALKDQSLPPGDRVRLLNMAADASLRQGPAGVPAAVAFYEQIAGDAAADNNARLTALNAEASAYVVAVQGEVLSKIDLTKAHQVLLRGLDLPNLTPESRAVALRNIGKFNEREDKLEDARTAYESIMALPVGERTKVEAQRSIADTLAKEGKLQEAVEIYRKNKLELVNLYQTLGMKRELEQECERILADPGASDGARWSAFQKHPCWDWNRKDFAAIRRLAQAYMPALLEKDPNRIQQLKRFLDVAPGVQPELVAWGAPLIVKTPKLSDADYSKFSALGIDALAALGKTEQAAAEAKTVAVDARVSPEIQYWAKLVAATLVAGNDGAAAKAAQEGGEKLSNKQKADSLARAARTALLGNNEASARALYAAYEKLLNRQARAAITCEFVQQAPYDVGSWLASPVRKNPAGSAKLSRPYGDNLKFLLETDSAMTGRNTSADSQGDTGDRETDFHVACDASGIHFFLYAYDNRVADIRKGAIGGGSLEMYLAPGDYQAYYALLMDLPKGDLDPKGFQTMYPNPMFRFPSAKDGSFRTQTETTDKGFATCFSITWDVFYDKLPVNGTKWQFESIRWTRGGGFSFGGSESVHNRSSWGDVVFSGLSDENLSAIKRGIIYKAAAKYRKDKAITGSVGNWADAELGDPAFFQAKVEPLVKILDEHALKLKGELSTSDVETLFREAVPGWMELPYRVAAMRAQYLQEKQLGQAAH